MFVGGYFTVSRQHTHPFLPSLSPLLHTHTSQKNSFPLREQNQEIHDTSSELLMAWFDLPWRERGGEDIKEEPCTDKSSPGTLINALSYSYDYGLPAIDYRQQHLPFNKGISFWQNSLGGVTQSHMLVTR